MPELTDIIEAVTSFVTSNITLIAASVVVGLMGWVVSRLIRSGR